MSNKKYLQLYTIETGIGQVHPLMTITTPLGIIEKEKINKFINDYVDKSSERLKKEWKGFISLSLSKTIFTKDDESEGKIQGLIVYKENSEVEGARDKYNFTIFFKEFELNTFAVNISTYSVD